MAIYPCKGCEDRVVGCHGTCERYLKACAENERIKEAELTRKQSWTCTVESLEKHRSAKLRNYRKKRMYKK